MNFRTALLAFPSSLVVAASAVASPPELGWTKKEDPFVAHINVERIVGSVLAPILSEPFRIDDGDQVWRKLSENLPLEPGRDIRSVTLLSVGPLDHDVVIVSRMSERADLLPDAFEEHIPGYRAIEIEGHTVHSWAELIEGKRRHIYGHITKIDENERMVIISTGWEYLLDTIAFASGEQPQAPVERADNVPGPMEDSAVYIYAPPGAFQSGEGDAARPHLEDAKWLVLDLSATAEQCMIRAAGDLGDQMKAEDFAQFMQGMLALGKMMFRDDESMKPVVRILHAARIAVQESVVTVELHAPARQFASALDAAKLRMNANRDKRGQFGFEFGASMKTKGQPEE